MYAYFINTSLSQVTGCRYTDSQAIINQSQLPYSSASKICGCTQRKLWQDCVVAQARLNFNFPWVP